MRSTRLSITPWLGSRGALRAVGVLAGQPHRVLRAFAGPWIVPPLSPRLPCPPRLGGLVRALGGRMIVANPNVAARLPREVAALATAVLGARLDGTLAGTAGGLDPGPAPRATPGSALGGDARDAAARRRTAALLQRLPVERRDALLAEPPAHRVAAALLEPATLALHLAEAGGGDPTSPARFVAAPRYRLVLAAGRGTPPSWDALEPAARAAPAVAWPPASDGLAWFATSLLVPDALAADEMDDLALAHWADVTGRAGGAGGAGRDRYWFADSWERFREPGRMVGHVTPQLVGRSRRLRRASELAVGGVLALTPDVERGTAVPPGYCLVDCAGTLEVALLTY